MDALGGARAASWLCVTSIPPRAGEHILEAEDRLPNSSNSFNLAREENLMSGSLFTALP